MVVLSVISLITAFLAVGVWRMKARTIFSGLFPKSHAFVQVYQDHSNFGIPLSVTLMSKRGTRDLPAGRVLFLRAAYRPRCR